MNKQNTSSSMDAALRSTTALAQVSHKREVAALPHDMQTGAVHFDGPPFFRNHYAFE